MSGRLQDNIVRSLGEQLKVPLLQTAALAELGTASDNIADLHAQLKQIETTARYALKLVDGFDLAAAYAYGQTALPLEPVPVGAVLQDVRYDLHELARQTGVKLDLTLSGLPGVVMAHYEGLRHTMYGLSYSFLNGVERTNLKGPVKLWLGARRTHAGTSVGLFAPHVHMTGRSLQRAIELLGIARRPFVGSHASAATGIFIAESLARSLQSTLRAGRHGKMTGLALTLMPSTQLSLAFGDGA